MWNHKKVLSENKNMQLIYTGTRLETTFNVKDKTKKEIITNQLILFNVLWKKLLRNTRPDGFCKKGVLRNLIKFTGKHLCQRLFFNKVAGLRPPTVLKKSLWHRCFTANFAKFLRTHFFTEHLRWLLLCTEFYNGETGGRLIQQVNEHSEKDVNPHMFKHPIAANHPTVTLHHFTQL